MPLGAKDCFFIEDRITDRLLSPMHSHSAYELTLVSDCRGARRIVGDSIESVGDIDLLLLGGGLEHAWEHYECTSPEMRVITVHFAPDLLGDSLLAKRQFSSIAALLEDAAKGVAFSSDSIMAIYSKLVMIAGISDGFERVLRLLDVLHCLSLEPGRRLLASAAFANADSIGPSRRVRAVQEYINANYRKEIRLADLAAIARMTPTAFSRFFKVHTGVPVSDYIIDVRLGHATRRLANSNTAVSQICYSCGFNNVSNFNRIFRKKKGCSPKEFRDTYHHHRVLS